LTLTNALSPLVDRDFIEGVLRRNFQPLFDPRLEDMLNAHYPRGVAFVLNGRPLQRVEWRAQESAPLVVRVGRKRKPVAAGYLERNPFPLPEAMQGLAASTFGKVIKRGWEWLGIAPAQAERLGGLIETPALAECLTLNKADFIRVGGRGTTYLAYRKAIQEAVSRQLADWGHGTERAEHGHRRTVRPLERDLERVLGELADDFPLLEALVEQRDGGQRRLSVTARSRDTAANMTSPLVVHEPARAGMERPAPIESQAAVTQANDETREPVAESSHPTPATGTLRQTGARTRRPARYGLGIQFEERPEDQELGHLVESTVWINTAHPAYRRAVVSHAEGYHVAVAAAMALATVAVDPAKEHAFITAFLARWGAADRRPPHPAR
jgi:hypothetical protein